MFGHVEFGYKSAVRLEITNLRAALKRFSEGESPHPGSAADFVTAVVNRILGPPITIEDDDEPSSDSAMTDVTISELLAETSRLHACHVHTPAMHAPDMHAASAVSTGPESTEPSTTATGSIDQVEQVEPPSFKPNPYVMGGLATKCPTPNCLCSGVHGTHGHCGRTCQQGHGPCLLHRGAAVHPRPRKPTFQWLAQMATSQAPPWAAPSAWSINLLGPWTPQGEALVLSSLLSENEALTLATDMDHSLVTYTPDAFFREHQRLLLKAIFERRAVFEFTDTQLHCIFLQHLRNLELSHGGVGVDLSVLYETEVDYVSSEALACEWVDQHQPAYSDEGSNTATSSMPGIRNFPGIPLHELVTTSFYKRQLHRQCDYCPTRGCMNASRDGYGKQSCTVLCGPTGTADPQTPFHGYPTAPTQQWVQDLKRRDRVANYVGLDPEDYPIPVMTREHFFEVFPFPLPPVRPQYLIKWWQFSPDTTPYSVFIAKYSRALCEWKGQVDWWRRRFQSNILHLVHRPALSQSATISVTQRRARQVRAVLFTTLTPAVSVALFDGGYTPSAFSGFGPSSGFTRYRLPPGHPDTPTTAYNALATVSGLAAPQGWHLLAYDSANTNSAVQRDSNLGPNPALRQPTDSQHQIQWLVSHQARAPPKIGSNSTIVHSSILGQSSVLKQAMESRGQSDVATVLSPTTVVPTAPKHQLELTVAAPTTVSSPVPKRKLESTTEVESVQARKISRQATAIRNLSTENHTLLDEKAKLVAQNAQLLKQVQYLQQEKADQDRRRAERTANMKGSTQRLMVAHRQRLAEQRQQQDELNGRDVYMNQVNETRAPDPAAEPAALNVVVVASTTSSVSENGTFRQRAEDYHAVLKDYSLTAPLNSAQRAQVARILQACDRKRIYYSSAKEPTRGREVLLDTGAQESCVDSVDVGKLNKSDRTSFAGFNGSTSRSDGSGPKTFKTMSGYNLKVSRAHQVSGMADDILSVGQLVHKGYQFHCDDPHNCYVLAPAKEGGRVLKCALGTDNLFRLDLGDGDDESATNTATAPTVESGY